MLLKVRRILFFVFLSCYWIITCYFPNTAPSKKNCCNSFVIVVIFILRNVTLLSKSVGKISILMSIMTIRNNYQKMLNFTLTINSYTNLISFVVFKKYLSEMKKIQGVSFKIEKFCIFENKEKATCII